MKANIESEEDIKEFLDYLKKKREEVEAWPAYKKVDGYACRVWSLDKNEKD